MMEAKEMQLLYCKWCPDDCQLIEEDKLGCLASSGFADEFMKPDQDQLRGKVEDILAVLTIDIRLRKEITAKLVALFPDVRQSLREGK